ncbi:MAG: biotin--[acetyl-CoA-carboxylase] ligase [Clostridiales bacterium]|nr:biotin--[acetyl-CoA-carboxylase] ligase [Clostridiales bacterium]
MYGLNDKKMRIERFEELPSTNDYAKERRALGEDCVVIARKQSGGRGTKGRSFVSTEGGLYMSKLTFYEDLPAKRAFEIMQTAATAVCETLRAFGVYPTIKWPNDILVNGKKICGILIENTFSGENVRASIVGIGLNVCNVLPQELRAIATTLQTETGKEIAVGDVEKILLDKLAEKGIWKNYAKYVGFIGERVLLLCGERQIEAIMLGVDEEGNLMAKTAAGEERFSSAEVSLRGV